LVPNANIDQHADDGEDAATVLLESPSLVLCLLKVSHSLL
jgi:hypothetical protein